MTKSKLNLLHRVKLRVRSKVIGSNSTSSKRGFSSAAAAAVSSNTSVHYDSNNHYQIPIQQVVQNQYQNQQSINGIHNLNHGSSANGGAPNQQIQNLNQQYQNQKPLAQQPIQSQSQTPNQSQIQKPSTTHLRSEGQAPVTNESDLTLNSSGHLLVNGKSNELLQGIQKLTQQQTQQSQLQNHNHNDGKKNVESYSVQQILKAGQTLDDAINQHGQDAVWDIVIGRLKGKIQSDSETNFQSIATPTLLQSIDTIDLVLLGRFCLLLEDLSADHLSGIVNEIQTLNDKNVLQPYYILNIKDASQIEEALTEGKITNQRSQEDQDLENIEGYSQSSEEVLTTVPQGSKLVKIVWMEQSQNQQIDNSYQGNNRIKKSLDYSNKEVFVDADRDDTDVIQADDDPDPSQATQGNEIPLDDIIDQVRYVFDRLSLGTKSKSEKTVAQDQSVVKLVFTHPLESVRNELYGGRKIPVPVNERTDSPDSANNVESDTNSDTPFTLYRRQFLTERSAQIEAVYASQSQSDMMDRLQLLADTSSSKRIWLRWVESLALKIENVRKGRAKVMDYVKEAQSSDAGVYCGQINGCNSMVEEDSDANGNYKTDMVSDEKSKSQGLDKKSTSKSKITKSKKSDTTTDPDHDELTTDSNKPTSGSQIESQLSSLPDTLSSELLAVITCRTVFSLMYHPKRKEDLPSMASAGGNILEDIEQGIDRSYNCNGSGSGSSNTNNSSSDSYDVDSNHYDFESSSDINAVNKSKQAGKMSKALSKKQQEEEGNNTLAIPFADLCNSVGDAINFEHNCIRLADQEKNQQQLELLQSDFSDSKKHKNSLRTRGQLLKKMQRLSDTVWSKIQVRIPLGGELIQLLLTSCPVECDYEDAKDLLSREQQLDWERRSQQITDGLVNGYGQSVTNSDIHNTSSSDLNDFKNPQYYGLLKSDENYQKVLINALYHRLVWRSDGKCQGQIVIRDICHKVFEGSQQSSPQTQQTNPDGTVNNITSSDSSFFSSSNDLVKPVLSPMLIPPLPWTGPKNGCYLLHPCRLIRHTGSPRTLDDAKCYDMGNVQTSLDLIGQVAWRINRRILKLMEEIWENDDLNCRMIGKIPSRQDKDISKMYTSQEQYEQWSPDERKQHILEIMNCKKQNERLVSERPTFLLRLNVARNYQYANRIYFPHSIDFRGRAYPLPPHLNHQGPDICRGLLEFADPKPLTERGVYWLKVQLANLYGKDKLTLDKRVEWTEENMDKIINAAKEPLEEENLEFWSVAGDGAWQFLSRCMEINDAFEWVEQEKQKLENSTESDSNNHNQITIADYPFSRSSCHMDGSCNGLQHYAALGRDEKGARAVNVLPSEVPQDVYTIVLQEVIKKVEEDAQGSGEGVDDSSQTSESTSSNRTKQQLANLCIQHGTLKRSTVKQTVMTIVYGVTEEGASKQVQKQLSDQLSTKLDPKLIQDMGKYLAKLTLSSVDLIFDRAMQIKKWFDKIAYIFAVRQIACSWISPIGLAITQPYYEELGKEVKCGLQTVRLNFKNGDGKVSGAKQKCGLPPNFVHSLDASHMMMVAMEMMKGNLVEETDSTETSSTEVYTSDSDKFNSSSTKPWNPKTSKFTCFAAVHDSFWTHYQDVDRMNYHIREEFIKLHTKPILSDLEEEFAMLLGDQTDILPKLPPRSNLELERVRESPYFFD